MADFGWVIPVGVVVWVLSSIVKIVPQQTVYVIERFGMYQKTLLAGLHFVIPFVDKIAYIHSIKEIPMDVQPQICITKDNTQVTIDGILYYKITDPKLASYGTSDFRFAIEQLAKTTLRSEVGKRELDRLLEERQTINFAVVSVLDEASEGWGVKLIRYEVKDITPPDIVLKTMQLQLTAEREKRAKIAQSEGDLQQQINRANGERQAAIAESEGKKQAVINKAMGDAESIRVVATATAEAISTVAKAIATDGGAKAVELKVAEQYVQAFSNLAKEGTTLIVPADLSNISSLISSAMSIVKKQS
ncbi:MAG: paraslipin [Vampirovibrio sp.]|jgi:regulator of protease activity HflC (stomatin/prohibitin superfamily)|nr:paraslipin [Vampirovibrio sp.]